jgi:hypothetical protein
MQKSLLLILALTLACHVLWAQRTMYVNSANGINLREGPGTNHKTLVTIPNGSELTVTSMEGDWIKVRYEGRTGYVYKQYLSPDKPRADRSSGNNNSSTRTTRRTDSYPSPAELPNWGIGLRLGDPFGLTVKKYTPHGKALEFNIGSTAYWGYDYRDRFYEDSRFRNYDYVGYRREGAISVQVHLLFQKDFPQAKGLQWYWGIGPQLRFNNYSYTYRYSSGNAWIYVTERVTDLDFGADGVLGLEYHIPNAPLSVFADANLFLELFDDPFIFFGQAGIGIRYNIK